MLLLSKFQHGDGNWRLLWAPDWFLCHGPGSCTKVSNGSVKELDC